MNELPLSQSVKKATQQNHEDVESLLLPVLNAIRSKEDYAAILKMFYGYFTPLEEKINKFITPAELPDINERRKASAIEHDLGNLPISFTAIPRCTLLPSLASTAQAFGALYVLEGSTLGGKMIARMLAKNKPYPIPEEALSFFSGYGEATGPKWKAFLQQLNLQHEKEDVVQAADETFLHLKGWMQQCFQHD